MNFLFIFISIYSGSIVGEAPAGITVGQFLTKIKQDLPAEPRKVSSINTPMCVMCEYAMSILEKKLITNNTEVRIIIQ